jgi:hypothetical protein
MKNRVPVDFLLIIIVYIACAGLIYGAVTMRWPTEDLGVTPGVDAHTHQTYQAESFYDDYANWSAVVGGISLFCAYFWYVLGEWGPRANTLSSGAWILVWLTLLVVTIATAMVAVFMGPAVADNGWVVTVSYMIWGPAFFYLATVLFSPVTTKYVVIGSSVIRRAW